MITFASMKQRLVLRGGRLWLVAAFSLLGLFAVQDSWADDVRISATRLGISGNLGSGFAPSVVYISKEVDHKWIRTDSTKVVNGMFKLTTDFDPIPSVRKVTVEQGSGALEQMLFTDADEAVVSLDKSGKGLKIDGSEANEKYSRMLQEIGNREQERERFAALRDSENLGEAQRTAAEVCRDSLYDIILNVKEKYMKASLDNILGVYLLSQICADVQATQTENYMKKVPQAFVKTEYYQDVLTYLAYDRKMIVGDDYKDFTLNTPGGKAINLNAMATSGTFTLLVFWASWSEDCRKEMPTLVKIYNEYKFGNIDILGVSLDTDKAVWTQAIKDWHMDWKQVSDLKGKESEVAREYGISKLPAVLILTQHNRVIYKGLLGNKLYTTIQKWGEK